MRRCFYFDSFGARQLLKCYWCAYIILCLILCRMSVEWSLSYTSVLRGCFGYYCTTSQISWCGRRATTSQPSSSPGMAGLITCKYINSQAKHTTLL